MPSDQPQSASRSVERKTLTDRVYEILREDILNNRLPPDTPIQEAVIARDLGVSRGPVREALQKLSAEGLVEIITHRGAVVTSLTWQEFIDAYRVREALESLATRLATPNLTPDDIAELEQLHEAMIRHAEAEAVDAFFAANAQFHHMLVVKSNNRKLIEMYYPLIDQMRRYRMRSLTLRGGLSKSCDEHKAILDAIKTGDADKAAILMSAHIQIPQQILQSEHAEDELQLVSNNRE
ncbi:MAG: GntR family transcriptional regulator [Anaerolineaceae bacterium]|nr:GntR family transcriptional regulator [Anaerolineaceae bacterium]